MVRGGPAPLQELNRAFFFRGGIRQHLVQHFRRDQSRTAADDEDTIWLQ